MARAKEILPAALFSVSGNSSKYEGGGGDFFSSYVAFEIYIYIFKLLFTYNVIEILHRCIFHTNLRNINTECWEKITSNP